MPLYEHVFLARPDLSGQQAEGLIDTYKNLIQENGGSVEKAEYWGLKPIAYRVKKNRKAHYALINIDAPHAAVAEMERQMRLSDDVMRYLTLKVDELEAGPSAMMQKRDSRDDRRGGRDRDRGDRGGRDRDRGERGDRDRGDRDRGDRDRGERRGGRERVAAAGSED
jgi:small subunit ribosomal protein S6